MKTFQVFSRLVTVALLLAMGASAHAVAINGLIESNGTQYSVLHPGSNPAGAGDPDTDWYWFQDGDAFNFDLSDDGLVTTDGIQSYELMSLSGNSVFFDIVSLFIDTNGSNGFAAGEMEYRIDGGNVRTFSFEDKQYGQSPFNSSTFDGMNFQAFAWGGDTGAELGLDFSFSGMLDPTTVGEPGTLALLGLGLLGFAARRRLLA